MSLKNFDILQPLGKGAYSTVYKVLRKCDQQIYALKKVNLKALSDKQKENALNEVRILASVKSPYIISYKDSFIEKQTSSLCLITEYADDGDLDQYIKKVKKEEGTIPQWQIWKMFIQIIKGLKVLHSSNIAHRDLKSANIFLFKNGKVKIGDMNVSKIIKGNLCETQTGTPYYACPQIWKDLPYNTKSDIWSLGCIIYEVATLHPPFEAQTMNELFKVVVKGIYPKISSSYSRQLKNTLRIMLQVKPENRPSIFDLFESPICLKKLSVFVNEEEQEHISLIETIKISNKKRLLKSSLPKATYDDTLEKKKSLFLPSLQFSAKRSKQKIKHIKSQKFLPPIFHKYYQ